MVTTDLEDASPVYATRAAIRRIVSALPDIERECILRAWGLVVIRVVELSVPRSVIERARAALANGEERALYEAARAARETGYDANSHATQSAAWAVQQAAQAVVTADDAASAAKWAALATDYTASTFYGPYIEGEPIRKQLLELLVLLSGLGHLARGARSPPRSGILSRFRAVLSWRD